MRLPQLQVARTPCRLIVVAPLVFALALSSCRRAPAPGTEETSGEALPEPVVPAGYQKIAPGGRRRFKARSLHQARRTCSAVH